MNQWTASSVVTPVPLLVRTRNIMLKAVAIVAGGVLLAAGCGASGPGTPPAPPGAPPTTAVSHAKSGGYGY